MSEAAPSTARGRAASAWGEIGLGLALALAAIAAFSFAVPRFVTEPSDVPYAALGPSFLPRIVLGAIAVLGAAIAVRAWWRPGSTGTPVPLPVRGLVPVGVALAVYLVAAPRLGATLTAIAVTSLLLIYGGERRPLTLAIAGVGLPVLVVTLFTRVASVPLPTGSLFP